ncbi:PREDICTED: B3 domain-containing protein REM-like 2 [Camelina sativa]|uniref:B3 domain-containing protein REM-like 2 n=1 Tax=Camelina sativa TaxID=90675 RepID=A0ABM0WKQ9_CAMSA|nr:PREDICTED: B3 domain-containing protein REM-like 2 [Camelina sativa]
MYGVSACDVRQPPSARNIDLNKTVNTSKKHQRPTEEGGDVQENAVLVRAKRGRKKKSIPEAGLDNSSFFAFVTASNLEADTLYLPQDFTSSCGLPKNFCKVVLTDGTGNSWELEMRYDKSCNRFYVNRGWRHFCDELGKKVGSVFTFELMKKWGTPFLSFSPSKATPCYETSEDLDNFMTLNLSYDSLKNCRLYLPSAIMRTYGLDETRLVTLLAKDGTRTIANLVRETSRRNFGRLSLGKAWREFALANNLEVGENFTLECIWENATPILRLTDTKPRRYIKRGPKPKYSGFCKKMSVSTAAKDAKEREKGKNIEEPINAASLIEKHRLVILPLLRKDAKACMLYLPSHFMEANGIDRIGKIVLLGRKGSVSWCGYLLKRDGAVNVGCGWKHFCKTNGVKIGGSFSLEFKHKVDNTPVLQFRPKLRRGININV